MQYKHYPKLYFVSIMLLTSIMLPVQKPACSKIFTAVETKAAFGNGPDGFPRFLERNLSFSDSCMENGMYPSHLNMKFLIDKNGLVQDVFFTDFDVSSQCKDSLRNIFLKMPKWKPAIVKGKPVCSYVIQNIGCLLWE